MIYKPDTSGVTVTIVHADMVRFLDDCTASGITMKHVVMEDEITAIVTVEPNCQKLLVLLCEKHNARIARTNYRGIYWRLRTVFRRPILIVGVAAILLISLAIPRFTLIIQVGGNKTIPDREILEVAEKAGIYFGASRQKIRSEQVKNQLLEKLPQLQWVGVNTSGCVATISVKERSNTGTAIENKVTAGIVATRDGIVQSVNITKGNALCVTGQAVKAGDMLVSPYTDCGLTIRVTGAEGEIYAETLRNLEVILPTICEEKGTVTGAVRRFRLQIGKKQIKFYKDSGIYDTSCDKMYKKYFLTLPGGFQMPVALVVEEQYLHENTGIATGQMLLAETVENSGRDYLIEQMVAGQILSSKIIAESDGTVCRIMGTYHCLEMIGRVQQEEKMLDYGKSD